MSPEQQRQAVEQVREYFANSDRRAAMRDGGLRLRLEIARAMARRSFLPPRSRRVGGKLRLSLLDLPNDDGERLIPAARARDPAADQALCEVFEEAFAQGHTPADSLRDYIAARWRRPKRHTKWQTRWVRNVVRDCYVIEAIEATMARLPELKATQGRAPKTVRPTACSIVLAGYKAAGGKDLNLRGIEHILERHRRRP